MRIVWMITVGSFLLSIAISENDIPDTNNVQRIPRAVILQPVIQVKNDDEEGPFDFISNWISRIINPPKKAVLKQPPILGPIRVNGLNDDVYIKHLQPLPHRSSHVIIKVMNNDLNKMPMSMPLMNPYQRPNYPMGPTQQMPMSPTGFHPISSPTPNSYWPTSTRTSQHQPVYHNNNIHDSQNSIHNSYSNNVNHYRNFRNVPGSSNNFIPNQGYQQNYNNRYQYQQQQPWQPRQYYPQYQSDPQSFYSPYDSRYQPQTGYGSNNFYNSIPRSAGRFSNYGIDSPHSTNYSRQPIHQDVTEDITAIEENEGDNKIKNSKGREKTITENEYKNNDVPEVIPTSTKVSTSPAELIEIYRSDRMVPTNPTYRNNFWTRTSKTTATKITSTTERNNDDEVAESTKKEHKYSSKGIEEIPAPDLKALKKSIIFDNKNPDSRMDEDDEDEMMMKDGTTLGKGETKEYINEKNDDVILELTERPNKIRKTTSRNSRNWRPIESIKRMEDTSVSNKARINENITPEALKKVMSLTANNSWRHYDTKKPSKRKSPRLKDSNNSRVRIVESVSSSVSMMTSRSVKKPKVNN